MSDNSDAADAVVIGAGLAGLVTAAELVAAGKRVIVLEQEPEASLGGQAWWSFGGLFLVDSPSSAAWACTTVSISPGRTGSAAPNGIATRTRGGGPGRRPT
ncbi:hypothetical protein GCM10025881_32510 [Pseudolysinimonas kribbensis]|uniref:FAD-dependent oxidoreductase 2 FAD-binding domain-containing protein n=1 Tax=Pseudolysinimonas kribbensis TaxID=433641 RepID=A0ABQ6K8V3_9MICO|nr:hypothetical protein GCM10025881_32510 [Pseudolysinimonas kribbensis]